MKHLIFAGLLLGLFQSQAAVGAVLSAGYRGAGTHTNMGSQGAVLTFKPNPKLGLSYSFNHAKMDVKDISQDGILTSDFGSTTATNTVDKADLNRQLHEAQLRWYPMGGSFFFGAGGAAGTYKGAYSEINDGNPSAERTYSGTTAYTTFNIGNVWEFKHFMLGAEWFGLSRNMSHTRKVSNDVSDSSQLTRQEENYRDYLDLATKTGGFTALMVHAGLSL